MSNDGKPHMPGVRLPWKGNDLEVLSQAAVVALAVSLAFCGLVDVLIWINGSNAHTVSERVAYYLTIYPWLGWALAGLAYHLLVRHPAGPLG